MADPERTDVDLESVMAGDELAGARETLAQWNTEGRAYRTSVEHHVWITRATADEAAVVDQYTTTSLKLEPATKEPLDAPPIVEPATDTFLLRNIGGTWKVVAEPQGS